MKTNNMPVCETTIVVGSITRLFIESWGSRREERGISDEAVLDWVTKLGEHPGVYGWGTRWRYPWAVATEFVDHIKRDFFNFAGNAIIVVGQDSSRKQFRAENARFTPIAKTKNWERFGY